MSAYQEFLLSKSHSIGDHGFYANWIPDSAFDFQRHIISRAVQKGRVGVFADTGLGKTLIQLAFAYNVVLTTKTKNAKQVCGRYARSVGYDY